MRSSAIDARGADLTGATPFSAWAIRSSGVSPGAPSSSASASCGEKPRPTQAVARERARVVGARDRDRRRSSDGADLLAQLDDDPLRRALADARHGLQARRVAGRDRGQQLARRAAGEHGERHLRADATARRSAAGTGRAPPRWRSRRAAARRRARSGACGASPACPTAGRGAASRPTPPAGSRRRRRRRPRGRRGAPRPRRDQRDHATPASAASQRRAVGVADRDRERVGGVVGLAAARRATSSAWTIRWTWSLAARPEPQTAPLTCCGV